MGSTGVKWVSLGKMGLMKNGENVDKFFQTFVQSLHLVKKQLEFPYLSF